MDLSTARGNFIVWVYTEDCERCDIREFSKQGVWFADCGPRTSNDEFEDTFDEGACFISAENDDTARGVSRGLSLPSLPEGWIYEGWVKLPSGRKISTGRFSDPNSHDNSNQFSCDHSQAFCSFLVRHPEVFTKTPLDFPGEDFVSNLPENSGLIDLTQSTVYITVEPKASNFDDPTGNFRPFSMKILRKSNPHVGTANMLNFEPDTIPTGSAVVNSDS